jgi:D-alanyl-D-alanine carboxypeptidase/D-alanyl-D-alanine-endopeptidase (penicillin-binding protein 4)
VLGLALVVPAAVLFTLWRWAGELATTDAAPPTPPPAGTPGPALATQMLGFRRMPGPVSRSVNVEAFRAEVDAFTAELNDRSCASVSVDGEPVGARNDDVAVIPASTQKLFVAAVALERLGTDFVYTTEARADVEPVGGVVAGDLYLVGGGDPLLSSDWYAESNMERYPVTSPTSLDSLADRVVAAGVTQIDGDVVGDGSRYDDEFYAPGWGIGVAGLEGGPYDALMANDSRVLGEELRAEDPNSAAAREFARLLEERGVTIAGESTSGAAPAGAAVLAGIDSAPLPAVVAEMLANSDNNTAELIVKELGLADSTPGNREAGLAVMLDQLDAWGVESTGLVFADGSGLSPDNRATCAALIEVLRRHDLDSPIGRGLPIAGETGTLDEAFAESPVAGRLRGKTGTLNNPPFNEDPPAVKALAGYLPVEGGGEVEYVLILNGPTISDQSEYRAVWDRLATTLDSYPSGPSPADLGVR